MKNKIEITRKQAEQFNWMLHQLKKISKNYMTTDQLRRESNKYFGLDYVEALEMAYDNIKGEAFAGSFKVKPLPLDIVPQPSAAQPSAEASGLATDQIP